MFFLVNERQQEKEGTAQEGNIGITMSYKEKRIITGESKMEGEGRYSNRKYFIWLAARFYQRTQI